MKFKVGDKVRFVREIVEHSNRVKTGKVYKIIKTDGSFAPYKVENGEWFTTAEIELAEYTYEDLKKSPIGTKITFENGEVLVKDDDGKYSNKKRWRDDSDLKELKDRINTLGKIIKIEEPTYTTVYEAKVEILDEAEKRYLRDVIRPFRDRVRSIVKHESIDNAGKSYIGIDLKDYYWLLPDFKSDEMYKGMKERKPYTLEELGL